MEYIRPSLGVAPGSLKPCDSALGAHEIDKVLKPGQTRTFEVNDGYVDSAKVQKMTFQVTDYDIIP
jgi:hypothetical protein